MSRGGGGLGAMGRADPLLMAGQNAASKAATEQVIQKSKGVDDPLRVKEVSQEFESLFVGMMLDAMRKSVPKSGFIDGGNAEDIYRGMLDSEYAKIISKQGEAGLAAMVEQQLLRLMGKSPTQATAADLLSAKKAYGIALAKDPLASQSAKKVL